MWFSRHNSRKKIRDRKINIMSSYDGHKDEKKTESGD